MSRLFRGRRQLQKTLIESDGGEHERSAAADPISLSSFREKKAHG
jgi:hypothetical protein